MIYLILLLLILQVATWRPSNTLACGLFGWLGDDSSKVSRRAITILGMYNQERGDDAVGLMTTSSIKKSVTNGKFKSFIINELDYNSLIGKDDTFILGHTRNASPGTSLNVANAQPVAYNNPLIDAGYGLIHNGNVRNSDEFLAEIGLTEDYNLSDSYNFAKVLFEKRTMEEIAEVLSRYTGKAALVWTDKDDPTVAYMFRGKSPKSEYQTAQSEERPLYYIQDSDNSIYFSSLEESLWAAFNEKENDVTELPPNMLYKVVNGVFKDETPVDRSKAYQDEYGYSNYNYGGYRSGSNKAASSLPTKGITKNSSPFKSDLSFNTGDSYIDIIDGQYTYKKVPLDGSYLINRFGKFYNEQKDADSTMNFYKILFCCGYIINTSKYYSSSINLDDIRSVLNSTDINQQQYYQKKKLSEITMNPVIQPLYSNIVSTALLNGDFYTGANFGYYFTKLKADFSNGGLRTVTEAIQYPTIPFNIGLIIDKDNSARKGLILNNNKLLGITSEEEENSNKVSLDLVKEMLNEYHLAVLDDISLSIDNIDDAVTNLDAFESAVKSIKTMPTEVDASKADLKYVISIAERAIKDIRGRITQSKNSFKKIVNNDSVKV